MLLQSTGMEVNLKQGIERYQIFLHALLVLSRYGSNEVTSQTKYSPAGPSANPRRQAR